MKAKFSLCIVLIYIFTFGSGITAHGMAVKDTDEKSTVFDFVESTPANAAEAVALDAQIKLLFNKNVVNMSVKDNNALCFLLMDEGNREVPIDIIFADDQIEPDKKREIILKPKEALQGNMTYRVEISPKLQSKNGSSLDKSISISFTTLASAAETAEPEVPEKLPAESDSSTQEDKAAVVVETSLPKQEDTEITPADTAKVAEQTSQEAKVEAESETKAATTVDNGNALNKQDDTAVASSPISGILPLVIGLVVSFMVVVLIRSKKRKP